MTVGYADNLAQLVVKHTGEELKRMVNEALGVVSELMAEHGLVITPEKTEAVILSRKRNYTAPAVVVNGQQVPLSNTLKYLGVKLDRNLPFRYHNQGRLGTSGQGSDGSGSVYSQHRGPKGVEAPTWCCR